MTLPVQRMAIETDGESIQGTDPPTDVSVFGNPFHENDLVDLYYQSRVNDFIKNEGRYSCGNYVLIDPGKRDGTVRIITSPGYCGGYLSTTEDGRFYAATTLRGLLEQIGVDELEFDVGSLLHYFDQNNSYRAPFSSVFDGVYRLPPGVVLELDGTEGTYRSYLPDSLDLDAPDDLGDLLSETVRSIEDQDIVLALSGGVDSTVLAVSLLENDIEFGSVTFDIGPGYKDAPSRATAVADRLSIDTEIIDFDMPPTGATVTHIEDAMRQDLINPRSPYRALTDRYVDEDTVVLSGQNMDAMVMLNMDNPNYSSNFREDMRRPKGLLKLMLFGGKNTPFTDRYFSHESIRKAYFHLYRNIPDILPERFVPNHLTEGRHDIDTSFDGVFRGWIDHRFPNVRQNGFTAFESVEGHEAVREGLIDDEITVFRRNVTEEVSKSAVQLFDFYMYCHNSNKLLTTLPLPGGAHISTAPSWGPSVSYFTPQKRTYRSAMIPKREIYEYVEKATGSSYHSMISGNSGFSSWENEKESRLLYENKHYLRAENSFVLSELDERRYRKTVERIYETAHEKAQSNAFTGFADLALPQRVLNLELLLQASSND